MNVHETGRDAIKTLFGIGAYLKKSSVETSLLELLCIRVSQINGCAYCIDMHHKDALAAGETGQRLYGLTAWRETPYYTARERAALALAEAVTHCDVPDAVYDEAKQHFSDQEIIDLTLAIATTNTWNRINVTFSVIPGTYRVGQFG